jgi:hypothetical protein
LFVSPLRPYSVIPSRVIKESKRHHCHWIKTSFAAQLYYHYHHHHYRLIKKPPWSEPASELYQPSDRCLSAKWLPTFADRGCHMISVTDPYGRILGFLDRSRYFSIK